MKVERFQKEATYFYAHFAFVNSKNCDLKSITPALF